jgi:hypothetical protein
MRECTRALRTTYRSRASDQSGLSLEQHAACCPRCRKSVDVYLLSWLPDFRRDWRPTRNRPSTVYDSRKDHLPIFEINFIHSKWRKGPTATAADTSRDARSHALRSRRRPFVATQVLGSFPRRLIGRIDRRLEALSPKASPPHTSNPPVKSSSHHAARQRARRGAGC